MIKSPIAYPGAKGKVCDKLMQMVPFGIEDWREPFFGGGSVTIAFLQSAQGQTCKRFVVGDLYKEVYLFWKSLQQNPQELISYATEWFDSSMKSLQNLRNTPPGTAEYDELYKYVTEVEAKKLWSWVQSVNTESLSDIQRGARFYLSSKMSFSGVADSGGMSKERVLEIDTSKLDHLYEVSNLLQKVEIYNQSFEYTMADVDRDKSFIFLDPPYITQEVGNLYGKNGSTHKGFPHEKLASLCLSTPCRWLVTIDDCVKARRYYYGAVINNFYIPYTMTSLVGRENRLNGEELLISNYDIYDKQNWGQPSSQQSIQDNLLEQFGF